MNYLEEASELGNKHNIGKRPTVVHDVFHSQFAPNVGKYLDNNNYLLHNLVSAEDERFWQNAEPSTHEFVTCKVGPSWISDGNVRV